MIPDIEKSIPEGYNRDSKLLALSNKITEIINGVIQDIFTINDFLDPVKIPAIFLDYLGFFLNAGINPQDTERQKRQKIVTAVQGHKKRGSFVFDAKPKIDAIAGGDSQIITQPSGPGWMMEAVEDSFSVEQAIFDSDDAGFLFVSGGDVLGWPGNIFIDVDNSSLSAADQDRIRLDLEDIVPGYMITHIGYLDGTGAFVEYFTMP